MTQTQQLNRIGSFGYGVYKIQPVAHKTFRHVGNFAVADPLAGDDGFYLVVRTIREAYEEMESAGLLSHDLTAPRVLAQGEATGALGNPVKPQAIEEI